MDGQQPAALGQQQGQQQQDMARPIVAVPSPQHSAAFMDQRRWGRRRGGIGGRSRLWPAAISAILLLSIASIDGNSSPSSNGRGGQYLTEMGREEMRQTAERTNQQLFHWQKQQQKRRNGGGGLGGEEEEGMRGREGPEGGGAAGNNANANNHIVLPYSQYEQMLLEKALAEQRSVEGGGQNGAKEEAGEEAISARPVIIRLPAYPKAKAEHIGGGGARGAAVVDHLLFQTGPHRYLPQPKGKVAKGTTTASSTSPPSPSHSSSFRIDGMNEERREERGHHHNPIRAQSSAAKWHQRKEGRAEREEEGTGEKQSQFGGMWEANSGELSMENGRGGAGRSRRPPLGSSSAEHSLITRPRAMFLPAPNRIQSSGGQLRPIQPINAATGQQQLFLKRIQSAASQMRPGTEIGGQELVERRLAPSAPLAAINQLFANEGAGIQPAQAPLAGSPFDLLTAAVAGGGGGGGAQQANGLISQLPNPLQILGQGTTLEQITTLARNLLQMSNGNQEILSSLTKFLSGSASADGAASKLTSSAVTALQKMNNRAAGEKTAIIDGGGNGTGTAEVMTAKEAEKMRQTLFSSTAIGGGSATNGSSKEVTTAAMVAELDSDEAAATNGTLPILLRNLPLEQRTLLEAAMKNGELDAEQAAKFIAAESAATAPTDLAANSAQQSGGLSTQKRVVNAESRLMEWIQQNRPRPGQTDAAAMGEQQKGTTGAKNGTVVATGNGKNIGGMAAKDWLWATAAAEKLPYYGRYCGSFVEQSNSTARSHNIAGALWAVDERRLVVTKFRFLPLDYSENITFWAGPANLTGTSADFFPSENGFYMAPLPLDAQTFNLRPIQKIEARIRIMAAADPNKSPSKEAANETAPSNGGPPEREFFDDDNAAAMDENKLGKKMAKRARRNLYNDLYGGGAGMQPLEKDNSAKTTATPTAANGAFGTHSPPPPPPTIVPMHFDGNARNFHLTLGGGRNNNSALLPSPPMSALPPMPSGIEKLSAHQQVSVVADGAKEADDDNQQQHPLLVNKRWQSLGWHGGIQPLLLTLPEGRRVRTMNWLAAWDHGLKQSHAMVLMPTGIAFQVPSTVQLRPLPSPAIGVTGVRKLQSGPIRVLDTKTIEVTEFSLRTEGLPVWFMVGKEIMPNARGNIAPVYNMKTRTFDCDSLREFQNETVTLRLPDPLDIKDVFWFAIFSIPRGIPLSHIYIPYNDMQLPPDLLALPTPQCIWQPAG